MNDKLAAFDYLENLSEVQISKIGDNYLVESPHHIGVGYDLAEALRDHEEESKLLIGEGE